MWCHWVVHFFWRFAIVSLCRSCTAFCLPRNSTLLVTPHGFFVLSAIPRTLQVRAQNFQIYSSAFISLTQRTSTKVQGSSTQSSARSQTSQNHGVKSCVSLKQLGPVFLIFMKGAFDVETLVVSISISRLPTTPSNAYPPPSVDLPHPLRFFPDPFYLPFGPPVNLPPSPCVRRVML